jgi:hypothetical protein
MNRNPDRLYDLLPAVHRMRDADLGYPLRGLLRVIAEQVNLVESDIAQLYENWFVETCQDWVVPYLGELIGYTPLNDLQGAATQTVSARTRNRILIPRREVANTIHYRRRKGTLSLLEDLALAVSGWPARAVEFYRLLAVTQNIAFPHLDRGSTADLRDVGALVEVGGPFDRLARTVDVRRVSSALTQGTANIPEVGVFVWRLRAYSVTQAPAYCFEEESPNCYLFSALGHDTALFTHPRPAGNRGPGPLSVPDPIRRQRFDVRAPDQIIPPGVAAYYGDGKSFQIWVGSLDQPITRDRIVPADLSDWTYRPQAEQVAVDPELGRIMFPHGYSRKQAVWVSYDYGFSADIGGGEYDRPLRAPAGARLYLVGPGRTFARIGDALAQWQSDAPPDAVIEITDSGVYVESLRIALKAKQTLQIRAANRRRPIIRLLDWQTSLPDDMEVTGEAQSWFTLDGLLVTGRGIQIDGDVAGVTIRHSTLVPGWGVHCDCEPARPAEASLELINAPACLVIEHSIVGAIEVDRDEVEDDPAIVRISDSIVDATSPERLALRAPERLCAHTRLTILRSTVFGKVQTHSLELAENSIFMGAILACRRQQGCVRFCYVTPGSRTPRRYECQPDLVEQAVAVRAKKGGLPATERDRLMASERLRVTPDFESVRYGRPTYCRLARTCAPEISTGADDESEMGMFHDLYQPLRAANLRARLDEYTPAGMDAGILFAS